jgi:hypothetical protein
MKALRALAVIVGAVWPSAWPLAAQSDKDKVFESVWTPVPVQVDGLKADWPPESLALWKNFNIRYGFRNDADFLYFVAVFNDLKFLSSLEQTGMFFWVDTEGKEKKTYGLHSYPKTLTADELIAELEKEGQTLTEQKKAELKARPQYVKLVCDAVNKKGQPIPHPVQKGGTFRYAKGQTDAVFEAALPLALLSDPAAGTALDLGKPFMFGMEWGGLTAEMKKARATQVGDQAVRAGGDESNIDEQVGGDHEGGQEYSPNSSLAAMRRGPKQYSFWINLKISAPK